MDQFESECARIAAKWFDGDTEKASEVFYSLPYSDIPDWSSVDRVMEAITGRS